MWPILAGLTWCFAHFAIYVPFRYQLDSELRILAFHSSSFAIYIAIVITWYMLGGSGTIASGVVAIHCLYSVSFLEIWSLTEGSYALSIMREIYTREKVSIPSISSEFSAVGDEKRRSRLQFLIRIGLVAKHPDRQLELTAIGVVVACILRALRALVNLQRPA